MGMGEAQSQRIASENGWYSTCAQVGYDDQATMALSRQLRCTEKAVRELSRVKGVTKNQESKKKSGIASGVRARSEWERVTK